MLGNDNLEGVSRVYMDAFHQVAMPAPILASFTVLLNTPHCFLLVGKLIAIAFLGYWRFRQPLQGS